MHGCGRIVFIESMFKMKRMNLIGYKDCTIKFMEFKELTTKDILKFFERSGDYSTLGGADRNADRLG